MTEASAADATDANTTIQNQARFSCGAKHHDACCSAPWRRNDGHQELLGLDRDGKACFVGGLTLTMTRALGILA